MSRSCSKSVRRTRSQRMEFCVQRGLGISPTSSVWEPSGYPEALLAVFSIAEIHVLHFDLMSMLNLNYKRDIVS